MCADIPDKTVFERLAASGPGLIPVYRRLMSDQLTPVLAYRRLVRPDQRMSPSFLLESVVVGNRVGRYSYLGAQPQMQVIARGHDVELIEADTKGSSRHFKSENPLAELNRLIKDMTPATCPGLPDFSGGWVGLAGYDTVRYTEQEKLHTPPPDDRGLPDVHMGLYLQVIAFDHVQKTVIVMTHAQPAKHGSAKAAYEKAQGDLDDLVRRIETPAPAARSTENAQTPGAPQPEMPTYALDLNTAPPKLPHSNMGPGGYQAAVKKIKQYIGAGDVFQAVPSQRFELRTATDPFDLYRALRVVNPSPYMFYLQIAGAMLIGSSPEILCRVQDGKVINRPLAGTRPRGLTPEEDLAFERELLDDPKERAEHIMLVDLGRNDIGRVARPGSVKLAELLTVERYSHVMHISSTVTGELADGMTCWDALAATLPVGTVSGAPKVRAMQIIDELEPTRRGPYAGAVGYADLAGNMDMAIALRTMVVTPGPPETPGPPGKPDNWVVHIQAGSGIVADSDPEAEHTETINKAAAMAKAVAIAEQAIRATDVSSR